METIHEQGAALLALAKARQAMEAAWEAREATREAAREAREAHNTAATAATAAHEAWRRAFWEVEAAAAAYREAVRGTPAGEEGDEAGGL